ncbi:DoxX family protein [Streptomyces rhizosphaerihabitans]|uniref:DoxX family protein n=1 Tax=Streptomyces rhizosphaerihabitans TaxID=1266770 RepID=UPI0021BF24E7|nr:DoxX family protein [Streptomyces rhizosphaerihabitans]MCT9003590.1 DoxX family protein [Streptomyces rhizosphaerihabitans]
MDTRTPRTPTGDRSSGFDDVPALSMVKVPSDPAQVIVNHASFRVQLAGASRGQSPRFARHLGSPGDAARNPGVAPGRAGRAAPADGARRRAPVVWSGKSAPDDTGAHRLLQAVRSAGLTHGSNGPKADAGSTQVIPRIGEQPGYAGDLTVDTVETPLVGSPRTPVGEEQRLLPRMRSVGSAYDERAYGEQAYADADFGDDGYEGDGYDETAGDAPVRRRSSDPVRHAYHPGRRMNLGVVLLPLRVFLGFISVYAGMGKLCDPVYFDGGKRGSMTKWLNTLHPWEVAEPLRQFALQHPVGSGLVIAFFQVIVGVLTVLGLWQRVAAIVGAMLSAALIVTVSWKTVPAYDAPDIIYLAAWSPLIIAGAPVYSADGRLASEAWRTLGPRADIWDLRARVLRRGALLTAIVVGLTLLIGSLLGGAVRDSGRIVVPGPGEAPRNELPGSPLPETPGKRHQKATPSASVAPSRSSSAPPSHAAGTPGATQETGRAGGGQPSQTQGSGQAPPQQSSPVDQAPSTSAGPTGSGGTSTGGSSGGSGGTGGTGSANGTSTGGGSSSTGQPGLVGGLLG